MNWVNEIYGLTYPHKAGNTEQGFILTTNIKPDWIIHAMNKDLFVAYYLKEDLKEIWDQLNKEQAGKVLDLWIKQAHDSKQKLLIKFANTLASHRTGILAWYDHCISTGKVEGINNKIKTMKRQAYGYRDSEFFNLKILAMHDKKNAFVG